MEKKVAHAERLIKQLNRKLAQYMNHTNSNIWINVLQDIIRAYNNSYHHSIQMTPNDARKPENNFKVWNNQYNSNLQNTNSETKKPFKTRTFAPRTKKKIWKFTLGDRVKISALKKPFDREYDEKFGSETFTITDRRMQQGIQSYTIKDEQNDPIVGWFYAPELLRVILPDDKQYKIEKVLKRRKRKGKTELFVKFRGYPKKFNSWVSDVENLK